jgi:hypothetical protein
MMEIANAIATFGLIPVVVAFFIYYIIMARKSNNKMQNDLNETMKRHSDENGRRNKETLDMMLQLIGHVNEGVAGVAENTKSVHTKAEEDENTRVNLGITQWLNKLVADTGANHAIYVVYHNGGRMNSNRYMQRMSISHESFDRYTTPLMQDLQNFPRTFLAVTVKEVSENGYRYVDDVADIVDSDPNVFNLCEPRGVKSFAVAGVRTSDQANLGFIVLEFKNQTNVSQNKGIQKKLRDAAIKIGTALEITKN